MTSQIIRDVILPELEKEVNTGKNFANLRQIFNSIILASWYKNNLKASLLNEAYSNKGMVKGIDLADKTIKARIYERYLQAYKKGVFNYIKEENATQTPPRKYFSGGMDFSMLNKGPSKSKDAAMIIALLTRQGLQRIVAQLGSKKDIATKNGSPADDRQVPTTMIKVQLYNSKGKSIGDIAEEKARKIFMQLRAIWNDPDNTRRPELEVLALYYHLPSFDPSLWIPRMESALTRLKSTGFLAPSGKLDRDVERVIMASYYYQDGKMIKINENRQCKALSILVY